MGQIIDGKAVSAKVKEEIRLETENDLSLSCMTISPD